MVTTLETFSEQTIRLRALLPSSALPIQPIVLYATLCVSVLGDRRAPVRGEFLLDGSPWIYASQPYRGVMSTRGVTPPSRLRLITSRLIREIDDAVIWTTSPGPLVGFRTPPKPLSNTLSAECQAAVSRHDERAMD